MFDEKRLPRLKEIVTSAKCGSDCNYKNIPLLLKGEQGHRTRGQTEDMQNIANSSLFGTTNSNCSIKQSCETEAKKKIQEIALYLTLFLQNLKTRFLPWPKWLTLAKETLFRK